MSAHNNTIHVRVSGSQVYNLDNLNVFWFSGGLAPGWTEAFTDNLYWDNQCSGSVEGNTIIYRFDVSDPSFLGHTFDLSITADGTHGQGQPLSVANGVSKCKTPGNLGAKTIFDTTLFIQSLMGSGMPEQQFPIHPYCHHHSDMGIDTYMYASEISGDECEDQSYACCKTSGEAFSEELTGLINSTHQALSGEYEPFVIRSYTLESGTNWGLFEMAEIIGTGQSSGEALTRVTGLASGFYNNGLAKNDLENYKTTTYNVNNIDVSFNAPFMVSGYQGQEDLWHGHMTGFSDRKHYVCYKPLISGEHTVLSADMICPNTDLQVEIQRDVTNWTTTGTADKPDRIVRDLSVSLQSICTGWTTTLDILCQDVINGRKQHGELEFVNGASNCWVSSSAADYFHDGNYILTFLSGAYKTNQNKYMVGTGTLTASEYV